MVVTMEIWCRGDGVDVVVRVAVKMMMTTVLWWWRGDDDEPVGGDDVDGVGMVMVVSMGLRWEVMMAWCGGGSGGGFAGFWPERRRRLPKEREGG
ncbi:hypothetical protein Tco_0859658 [Tanacetum coccineum]|uniref:Uncharacterized protein n=1 Tax=Tanacetum coccineum TaxID=301880 RepID=A0ABQ5BG84_9ASTR